MTHNNPHFRNWFGASKVVDQQGNPLTVYHGTNQSFTRFSRRFLGRNTNAACSTEFFFTEDAKEAGHYAAMAARHQIADSSGFERKRTRLKNLLAAAERSGNWGKAEQLTLQWEELEIKALNDRETGQTVLPVFLRIENPHTVDCRETFDGHLLKAEIKKAKKQKHDGLRLLNVYDPIDSNNTPTTNQWVVFSNKQIKSAIGNCGRFDPNNTDICQ